MMRTRLRPTTAAMVVAATALCCMVGADEAALTVQGGAVAPVYEHPAISMDRCIVNADIYPDDSLVRCEFLLRNQGGATSVLMGFPASGAYGEVQEIGFSPRVEDLRMWVDGQEVSTDLRPGYMPNTYLPQTSWYIRRVPFAAGQTRAVRVEYTQPIAFDRLGDRYFRYAVTTGNSWHGPIGEVQITLRWTPEWEWTARATRTGPWRFRLSEDGRRASCMATDIQPDYDIIFWFWPGWRAHCAERDWLVRPYGVGDFDMAVADLAEMLAADKRWNAERRAAELVLDDGTALTFTEGVQSVKVAEPWGGDTVSVVFLALPRPAYRDGGSLWTPARSVLRHLGYRATTDLQHHQIDITPPR